MMASIPPMAAWLANAKHLPLAFAQVREDPQIDLAVVAELPAPRRIAMVGSGGCTLALLSRRTGINHIDVIDPNPAQLALARFKLELLQSHQPGERRWLLGHATGDRSHSARKAALSTLLDGLQLPANMFGDLSWVAAHGVDHAGRYEVLFAHLRGLLVPSKSLLDALLQTHDLKSQAEQVAPGTPLGDALVAAFSTAFALPNLVALFGEAATRNPLTSFSAHFLARLHWALAHFPTRRNPFIWQLLAGIPAPDADYDWITLPIRQPQAATAFHSGMMDDFLRAHHAAFDLVHLSNILDWLSPEEAFATLDAAHRALRPGGRVLIRQLNSTLDIPAAHQGFGWRFDLGRELLEQDRSFFYRAIHVGEKP